METPCGFGVATVVIAKSGHGMPVRLRSDMQKIQDTASMSQVVMLPMATISGLWAVLLPSVVLTSRPLNAVDLAFKEKMPPKHPIPPNLRFCFTRFGGLGSI